MMVCVPPGVDGAFLAMSGRGDMRLHGWDRIVDLIEVLRRGFR